MKLYQDDIHETDMSGQAGAIFSPCRQYRYLLYRTHLVPRQHNEPRRIVAFVCLNPSKATATEEDPTVRRCIGYAAAWGYHTYCMLNIFAFRATDPKVMMHHINTFTGPPREYKKNRYYIRSFTCKADATVCGWGASVEGMGEEGKHHVKEAWDFIDKPTYCLGTTGAGHPKHPLYLPTGAELLAYNRLPPGWR